VKTSAWPTVLAEEETLGLVLDGHSLARYGDGEFKLCNGYGIKSQRFDPKLQQRLREILRGSGDCLVGIPNLKAPTKDFWNQFRGPSTTGLLDMKRTYASAFISRPDSAPWIHKPSYWEEVESLWRGQEVTLVRGSSKSLTAEQLSAAAAVREVLCDRQHAWQRYPELLERIGRPRRALLCCGPTATVLALDLSARGVHAIDLGHIGMFLRRQKLSAEAALMEGRRDGL
jgi:hypothetical protein